MDACVPKGGSWPRAVAGRLLLDYRWMIIRRPGTRAVLGFRFVGADACGGLENRFRGFSSDEGSNPCPSVVEPDLACLLGKGLTSRAQRGRVRASTDVNTRPLLEISFPQPFPRSCLQDVPRRKLLGAKSPISRISKGPDPGRSGRPRRREFRADYGRFPPTMCPGGLLNVRA